MWTSHACLSHTHTHTHTHTLTHTHTHTRTHTHMLTHTHTHIHTERVSIKSPFASSAPNHKHTGASHMNLTCVPRRPLVKVVYAHLPPLQPTKSAQVPHVWAPHVCLPCIQTQVYRCHTRTQTNIEVHMCLTWTWAQVHRCLTRMPHTSPNTILMYTQVPHMHISSGAQVPHTYASHITQPNIDVRAGASHAHKHRCTDTSHTCLTHLITQPNFDVRADASHAHKLRCTGASHICLTHHPTKYWCTRRCLTCT